MVPAAIESTSGTPSKPVIAIDQVAGYEQIERLKEDLRQVIRSGGDTLTLDLEAMTVVSSDLINFLLWCQMECSRNFVHLRVRNISSEMLRVFRFAGLNQVIVFEE